MDISGRHIVVTGGGSGIGRAMVQAFATNGARAIVIADIDEVAAKSAAAEVGDKCAVIAVGCDVSEHVAVEELIDEAERNFGAVEIFCANAGVAGGTTLDETPDDGWSRAYDVNVLAHVWAARRLVPAWVERGEGYFLSTASAAGLLNLVGGAPYAVTKAAAVAFAEWLAITYGDKGVRVSCLCPSAVRTPMLAAGLQLPGEAGVGMRIVTGSGPVLDPDDVAIAVVEGLAAEKFLILPHAHVQQLYEARAADLDRWISGLQHARAAFG